jgi:hypothetical protein
MNATKKPFYARKLTTSRDRTVSNKKRAGMRKGNGSICFESDSLEGFALECFLKPNHSVRAVNISDAFAPLKSQEITV